MAKLAGVTALPRMPSVPTMSRARRELAPALAIAAVSLAIACTPPAGSGGGVTIDHERYELDNGLDVILHVDRSDNGMDSSNAAPRTEFPRSIGKVAARELANAGYTHFEPLTQVSKKSLLAIHGVGPKALSILEEELQKRGLAYKE